MPHLETLCRHISIQSFEFSQPNASGSIIKAPIELLQMHELFTSSLTPEWFRLLPEF